MPEESDFYASLYTTRSRRRIARLFSPPTWKARKCAWSDYEITSSFAELVIEAESPILLHGWLTDYEVNAEQVLARLRSAGVSYTGECYSPSGELVREFAWVSPNPALQRPWPAALVVGFIRRLLGGPVR
jgi:hypothetical protein